MRGRPPDATDAEPTIFSAAQLAASAAGDPRSQGSFATTAEWQAYQAEWFKTVTMGEDLPLVGDPNRAKRWKSTRQQRGKIELQRERQQQPRTQTTKGDPCSTAALVSNIGIADNGILRLHL